MSKFEQRYIVQDLESHEFIYPDPFGDIGFTANLKAAGKYESYEDALIAGVEEIGGNFQIFSFYEKTE